ncbi:MAG: carboxylesterase family protein [Pseudomonadota bacterium]
MTEGIFKILSSVLTISSLAFGLNQSAQASVALTANKAALVQTQSGPVRGQLSESGAVQVWLGIPFAQPPTGERRWQAPKPLLPWTKELQANAYGSACPQLGGLYGPPLAGKKWGLSNAETFGKPVGQEDCLKLNIWRPSNSSEPMPVIVFVHGGSNVSGHGSDPLYDGQKLALATHAVIVTINYRLGIFGWFAHPSLEGNGAVSDSGNYAALDIIQALRFVHANAAAFGGDPKNITLMGQSAGAGNTYILMGSPLAQGLFQKAIVLSGLIEHKSPKQDGYAYVDKFMSQMMIDDHLATTLEEAAKVAASKSLSWKHDYLKSKTADQLLNVIALHKELFRSPHGFNDGVVLSDNLPADIQQGRIPMVPMIVGSTREESKLLFSVGYKVSGQQLFDRVLKSDPNAAPSTKMSDLVAPYFLADLTPSLFNTMHWGISTYLQRKLSKDLAILPKHNAKVYAYRFDWDNAPEPWHTFYGACHACDLPFIFGNFSNNFFSMESSQQNRTGREALSASMMSAISAFIRTGNPNNPKLRTSWKPLGNEAGNQQRLIFDATDQDAVLSMQ